MRKLCIVTDKVLEDEPVSTLQMNICIPAVIHPVPPCSWHAISIYPKPELATQWFLGCHAATGHEPAPPCWTVTLKAPAWLIETPGYP